MAKGELVGVYSGLIDRENSQNMHYLMRTPDLIIDALNAGNYTRYFNHSSMAPNLDLKYVYFQNLAYSLFITNRKIEMGEELLFNYSYDQIGDLIFIKMDPYSRFINPK